MTGFLIFVCVFSDLSLPFWTSLPLLFCVTVRCNQSRPNTRWSFCLHSLSCFHNNSDVSCHLLCARSVLGAKLSALHILSLSLPYEVDDVILILQPMKWSLREASVPKDTQLVNGETRIETQDSDSRAHALAQETTLPGMFSYIPAHGSPTHRSKPTFNAHSSLIITTRNLRSLLPICLQHLTGTSLSLKRCCFVLVAVDTGGFSLLPGCLLLYRKVWILSNFIACKLPCMEYIFNKYDK